MARRSNRRTRQTPETHSAGTAKRSKRFLLWVLVILSGILGLAYGLGWFEPRRGPLEPLSDTLAAQLAQGVAAAERGAWAEAARYLDEVLREVPGQPQASLIRGQVFSQQGDTAEALRCFQAVPDEPIQTGAPARFAEGVLLVDQGQVEAGEVQLRRALRLNPRYLQAHERLLQLHALLMRREAVRAELEAIRYLRPWTLEELVLYSVAGERIEQPTAAIPRLEKFVAQQPHEPTYPTLLARYLLAAGRPEEAESTLQAWSAKQPHNTASASNAASAAHAAHAASAAHAELLGLQAELRLRAGDLEQAAKLLARLPLPEAPSRAERIDSAYWKASGQFWSEVKQWEYAADCYAAAVQLDDEDLGATHQLGVLLARLGRREAATYLRRAEQLDRLLREAARIPQRTRPEPRLLAEILLNAADALTQLQRHQEAVLWYDQVLLLQPDSTSARTQMQASLDAWRAQAAAGGDAANKTLPGSGRRSSDTTSFASYSPSAVPMQTWLTRLSDWLHQQEVSASAIAGMPRESQAGSGDVDGPASTGSPATSNPASLATQTASATKEAGQRSGTPAKKDQATAASLAALPTKKPTAVGATPEDTLDHAPRSQSPRDPLMPLARRSNQSDVSTRNPIVLRDVHGEAGIDYQYFNGQSPFKFLLESMGGGVAVLDYDLDGWPDLYLIQGCELVSSNDPTSDPQARAPSVGHELAASASAASEPPGSEPPGSASASSDRPRSSLANSDVPQGVSAPGAPTSSRSANSVARDKTVRFAPGNTATGPASGNAAQASIPNPAKMPAGLEEDDPSLTPRSGELASKRYQNRLYRNLGNGHFRDVTHEAGLGDVGYGQGVAVGDYDNDGDSDLLIANFGRNSLYHNHGDGTFSDVTKQAGLSAAEWSSSAAFADLDQDGALDLYVVNYVDSLRICRGDDGRIATCDPANFQGAQDRLYHNRGDGTFADVTREAGINAPNGKGLGLVVADLDGDRRAEIYVANDGTPNFLFRNESRPGRLQFTEIGALAGVAVNRHGQAEGGMGIACSDFDGDGKLDLYVTNFSAETNTFYRNLGDLFFEDVTEQLAVSAITRDLVGFGVQPIDFDLDGHDDLLLTNGHIDDFRFRGEPWKMRPLLLQNLGHNQWRDRTSDAGPYFAGEYLGRGLVRWDWDADGDPDALIVHQDAPLALLSNESPTIGNWLKLEFRGLTTTREALGTRVELHAEGLVRHAELTSGDGFYSSNQRCLHLGLGAARTIDRLIVTWPDGQQETFEHLSANQHLRLIQGQPPHRITNQQERP